MITGYLLGVDVGTTSIKVAIINEKAQLLGMSSSSYKLIIPDQDSVQIDTEDMWRAYLKCIRLLKDGKGIDLYQNLCEKMEEINLKKLHDAMIQQNGIF